MKISLVVPVFNEGRRFWDCAPRLADFIFETSPASELIFVDDGSTDETRELIREFLRVREQPQLNHLERPHEGKGAAIHSGLERARNDQLAFCDLDLSTPLNELRRLIEVAAHEQALAIGSRGLAGALIAQHQSFVREALGRSYNRVVQFALVPGIFDTQCGAKAAPREVWERLLPRVREKGYAWDVEILYLARQLGVPVREIPIKWSHDRDSKVRVIRDGISMTLAIRRIRSRHRELRRAHPVRELTGRADTVQKQVRELGN